MPERVQSSQKPIFISPKSPQIIVPESVKARWKAVELNIENKTTGESQVVTVNIGAEYMIPGSAIRVQVINFLPDFKMEGTVITSQSSEPNNPAALVKIYEGSAQLYNGWLYAKFPAIHPFQNEEYSITLRCGPEQ